MMQSGNSFSPASSFRTLAVGITSDGWLATFCILFLPFCLCPPFHHPSSAAYCSHPVLMAGLLIYLSASLGWRISKGLFFSTVRRFNVALLLLLLRFEKTWWAKSDVKNKYQFSGECLMTCFFREGSRAHLPCAWAGACSQAKAF